MPEKPFGINGLVWTQHDEVHPCARQWIYPAVHLGQHAATPTSTPVRRIIISIEQDDESIPVVRPNRRTNVKAPD